MDVFYYWKSFDEDIKDRRLGWMQSERPKLGEMRSRSPDNIWVFRTPKGHKGSLQILACLKWSDKPLIAMPKVKATSVVYYDPFSSDSVIFTDSFAPEKIEAVTLLLKKYFPQAFKSNFQGDNGIHALEADFLFHLKKLIKTFTTEPFSKLLEKNKPQD
jgi:hypothetical protein